MNDKQLYHQLLGLVAPWQVVDVELDVTAQVVLVHVATERGAKLTCAECGRECPGYDLREERRWRHMDSCGFTTWLVARVPRVQCAEHGVQTVSVPWSEPHSRFTLAFETFAIAVLKATGVQARTAALLRLSPAQVHEVMHSGVNRGLARRESTPVEHLSLDEKSFGHGQRYVSVLGDNSGKRILEVVEDRTKDAAVSLLNSLSTEQKAAVKSVSMDMWQNYMRAREEILPQAETVHDRFHIAGYLAEAVDKTRREEHRYLVRCDGDSPLNKSKFLWLKNPENHSDKQKARFAELLEDDLKTAHAWAIKEYFRHFFTLPDAEAGIDFFAHWYAQVVNLGNRHMTKVSTMLLNHLPGLIAYLRHRTTNALAEGFNGRIQLIKANARGYRRFENFRVAILFFLGKLNMNPQESS